MAPSASAPVDTARVSLAGEGEFVETERGPEFSTVEVRKAPPGSVPSSMYTLRGVCAVLRARQAPFVSSVAVAGAAVPTYRLSFPASVPPEALSGRNKNVFSAGDCALLHF